MIRREKTHLGDRNGCCKEEEDVRAIRGFLLSFRSLGQWLEGGRYQEKGKEVERWGEEDEVRVSQIG